MDLFRKLDIVTALLLASGLYLVLSLEFLFACGFVRLRRPACLDHIRAPTFLECFDHAARCWEEVVDLIAEWSTSWSDVDDRPWVQTDHVLHDVPEDAHSPTAGTSQEEPEAMREDEPVDLDKPQEVITQPEVENGSPVPEDPQEAITAAVVEENGRPSPEDGQEAIETTAFEGSGLQIPDEPQEAITPSEVNPLELPAPEDPQEEIMQSATDQQTCPDSPHEEVAKIPTPPSPPHISPPTSPSIPPPTLLESRPLRIFTEPALTGLGEPFTSKDLEQAAADAQAVVDPSEEEWEGAAVDTQAVTDPPEEESEEAAPGTQAAADPPESTVKVRHVSAPISLLPSTPEQSSSSTGEMAEMPKWLQDWQHRRRRLYRLGASSSEKDIRKSAEGSPAAADRKMLDKETANPKMD